MTQIPSVGDNRTGAATHGKRAEAMVRATQEFPPSSPGSDEVLAAVRVEYAREARPVGSMPPLPDKTSQDMVVFMDMLGARLAFERTGVRLYDALLAKHQAYGSFDGGPSQGEIERIRDDEYTHFSVLCDIVQRLGGDPTAVTPAANLEATLAAGPLKVVADPRTTLLAALHAILVAELVDNESWEALIELARHNGHDDLAEQFTRALQDEEEHLESVRRWVAAGEGRTGKHH